MQTLNQLKQQSETIASIRDISQALGDIATTKLKATRASVEQNIKFFQEISQVYRLVKTIVQNSNKNSTAFKQYLKIKQSKNNQTICVLLTSSQHFYGGLDNELTRFYIDSTSDLNCQRIVIGAMGQDTLDSSGVSFKYQFLTFKKDFPTLDELNNLAKEVFSFTKILVFHTKFVTVLNQVPTASDISFSESVSSQKQLTKQGRIYYLVEPEIGKMMQFFESQILILLFQAIFLEVDIARLAARMIAMNQAGDNAEKQFAQLHKQILTAKKQALNLQMQETYAGLINKRIDNSV